MALDHDGAERMFDAFDGLEFGVVPGSSPGELLRRAREARGLTLDDASRATRIPARHLASIETADYRAFHASLYAVGFARTYARYLGVADDDITRSVRSHYERGGGPRLRFLGSFGETRREGFPIVAIVVALFALAAIALALIGYVGDSGRG